MSSSPIPRGWKEGFSLLISKLRNVFRSISRVANRRENVKEEPLKNGEPGFRARRLNKRVGSLGERAAAGHLHRLGYRIIATNHTNAAGEIDIIAEHNGLIVFVEVKTRTPRSWLSPESAVDNEKRGRIIRASRVYLSGFRSPSPARYDIVSVLTNEKLRVESIKVVADAFHPESVIIS